MNNKLKDRSELAREVKKHTNLTIDIVIAYLTINNLSSKTHPTVLTDVYFKALAQEIEKKYIGQFDSDVYFAKSICKQKGYVNIEHTAVLGDISHCIAIDWSETAENIMHYYSKENGYYFNN